MTQLLVKLDGDPDVLNKLEQIQLQLFDPDATDESKPAEEQVFKLTRGQPSATAQRLPFSFGIAHGERDRLKLVVKGFDTNDLTVTPKIEQKLVASFKPGDARWVSVYLWTSCWSLPRACIGLDRTCAPASGVFSTSSDGECGAVDEVDTLASEPATESTSSAAPTDSGGCETARLCTLPDYPCVKSSSSGYECQGQFAEWPMPNDGGDSRAKPHYTASGAGSVVDDVTGLVWQDVPNKYAGCSGKTTGPSSRCTWREAKQYCEHLDFDHASWRLPTKIELESIVGETYWAPAIDPMLMFTVFGDPNGNKFWTASPVVDENLHESAYLVDFAAGLSDFVETSTLLRVRCVRSNVTRPGTPADRYSLDSVADVVTDNRTGLDWQRRRRGPFDYQSDAAADCATLGEGWRLPDLKELLTLIDPSRPSPSVDPIFPDVPRGYYWTATMNPYPLRISDISRDVGPWYLVSPYTGGSTDARVALHQLQMGAPNKPELLTFYSQCVRTH